MLLAGDMVRFKSSLSTNEALFQNGEEVMLDNVELFNVEQYNLSFWKCIVSGQSENKYFKLRDAFADIQYVFASTIHKLQGSTYNTDYIDLASLINNSRIPVDLKYRLAYVAITRARKQIKRSLS